MLDSESSRGDAPSRGRPHFLQLWDRRVGRRGGQDSARLQAEKAAVEKAAAEAIAQEKARAAAQLAAAQQQVAQEKAALLAQVDAAQQEASVALARQLEQEEKMRAAEAAAAQAAEPEPAPQLLENTRISAEEEQAILDSLSEMESDGLIFLSDRKIQVTEKGRGFVRNIAMAFDLRLKRNRPEQRLFSMTV